MLEASDSEKSENELNSEVRREKGMMLKSEVLCVYSVEIEKREQMVSDSISRLGLFPDQQSSQGQ